jgi:hypothetical protein
LKQVTNNGLHPPVSLDGVFVSFRPTHPFSECPAEVGDMDVISEKSLLTRRDCIVREGPFSIVGVLLLCKEHCC